MYIKTERAAGELECQSGHLSQTVRSSKAAANKRSQRRYGASVTATAKAQQVMPSMRGLWGPLPCVVFYSSGVGGKRRIHCHAFEARAGKNATQNRPAASQSANAIRGGSIKGKAGERVQAKGGRL